MQKHTKLYFLLPMLAAAVVGGLIATTLLSQATVVSAAQADYFLKLDGIDGASSTGNHKGEIEVMSWSFGASNPSVATGGGGLGSGVGKVSRKGITITKMMDKASALLYTASVSGKHVKTATFTANNGGDYFTIKMSDVIVSSYTLSGNQGEAPMETISFSYSKIEFGWPK